MRDESGKRSGTQGTKTQFPEREKAEQGLVEREMSVPQQLLELEHLYQTAPVGLSLLDRDLRFLRINERLAALNGKPVEDHIGRSLREVIPDIFPRVEPLYRHVIETGEPIQGVEVSGRIQDRPITGLVSYFPLKNEDGTVIGVSSVVQDITERKRMEDALRQNEERMRRLLESTNAVPWEADEETCIFTYVGPQVQQLLGYPAERWYEPDFWASHIHPDDREYALDFCLNSAQHKPHFEFEYRMISASGEIVWVQDIVTVLSVEGTPRTLRGFLIDITERKKIELELEREKEILQTVFDHIPVMVSLYSGTKTQRTNHLFEETLGWSQKELQDKDALALCYPDPAYRQEVLDYIATAPSGWKDFKTTTRDGSVIDTSWANVHLSNGLSVGIGQDITRRKRSEEALRENQRALLRSHQQLQELARKLLSVQEEERRRISRDLHDDLNQQLATLSIAIGTLKRSERTGISDELSKLQELVKGISDDVRAMSRKLHPASLEHLGLVAALKTHCDEFCQHECVECTLSLPDDLKDLPFEVALCLYRIAQEGLRNIGKHSKAKKAQLGLSRDKQGVRLFIRDDGVGFEPDRVGPSRGLGLISMEERARLLQGNLSIKSQPGHGTEIEVFIPMSEGA